MKEDVFNINRPENLPLVKIELSVGQCKVIYALLWSELSDFEQRYTIFSKSSLETLYELFERHTQENDNQRRERIANWDGQFTVICGKNG